MSFVLIPQYFGSLVFNRHNSRYYPFDHTTTDLLLQSLQMPFEAVLASVDESDQDAAFQFFDHFYEMGMFTLDRYFAGRVLDVHPAEDHLTGPLAVHLEVIAACNLTCTHCFAGELPRREDRLTLPEIDALFADMAGMGSFRLGLTGGEPLMRRDIFEIIDVALEHGLHPCLTTNALLVTEDIAREFGKRDMVWLNVSLEGATAATNDRVRGSGTFDRVIEKLKILAEHTHFTLAFTIMSTNVDEVVQCAELAREVGAATAVFRPLYPMGTARQFLDELMPTFEQYNTALNLLAELELDMNTIDPFSPHIREETRGITHTNHGCGAGNSVCSVSVSGDVNPCSFLGADFVADNIRQHPLSDIWHHSPRFQHIRTLPGGTVDTFSGGCRARSLILNGDANASDPWLEAKQHLQERQPNVTFYDPLTVLDVNSAR